jgi:hypothetical protein
MIDISGTKKNGMVVAAAGVVDLRMRYFLVLPTGGTKTIRDFSGSSKYRKTVGVDGALNATIFTSAQVAAPFMTVLSIQFGIKCVRYAILMVPGKADVPPFLWNPRRIANRDIDVFTLSGLARQAGINAVVSPLLMDIRAAYTQYGLLVFQGCGLQPSDSDCGRGL